jgi:hypothetical protein
MCRLASRRLCNYSRKRWSPTVPSTARCASVKEEFSCVTRIASCSTLTAWLSRALPPLSPSLPSVWQACAAHPVLLTSCLSRSDATMQHVASNNAALCMYHPHMLVQYNASRFGQTPQEYAPPTSLPSSSALPLLANSSQDTRSLCPLASSTATATTSGTRSTRTRCFAPPQ